MMKHILLTSLMGMLLGGLAMPSVVQAVGAGTEFSDGSFGDYAASPLINTLFTLTKFYEGEELNDDDPLCIANKTREELRAQAMQLILANENDCVNDVHHEAGYTFPAVLFAIEAGELELVRLMILQGCALGDKRVELAPKARKGRALASLQLYRQQSKQHNK